MNAHIPADDLALLAMGEQIPGGAHLADCPQCARGLEELRDVVGLARRADPEQLLMAPPAHVWAAIAAEVEREEPALQADAGQRPADPGASHAVQSLSQARRAREARPRPWLGMAAAAACGAIVGGLVVGAASGGTPQPTPSTHLVATAVLSPLDARTAQPGRATVSDGPDGPQIRVDATSLPPGRGFYEVWLLDAQATKLVALGALPPGSIATFTIPPGVSVSDYPVVDISLEPLDGKPGHSHDSYLRGTLQA